MYGFSLRRAAVFALSGAFALTAHAQVAPLAVDVEAAGAFDEGFEWDIDKSVVPEFSDRFIGESQELAYTITVTKGASGASNFEVTGTADITNPNAGAATITSITIMYGPNVVVHACPTGELAGGATQVCNIAFSPTDATTQTLSVDVATSGDVPGGSDSTSVSFTANPTNNTVTVTDTHLVDPLEFSESGVHEYELTYDCSTTGDSVVVDNTATIVETGDDATAQARIGCHTLRLERRGTANPGLLWTWEIEKTLPPDLELPLELAAGDSYEVDYTITATAMSEATAEGAVTGTVKIINTHPTIDGELLSVGVVINGTVDATVTCPSMFVPDADSVDSIVTNGELLCTFEATMPMGETATMMTATVVQQLYDYASDGTPTANGTREYSGSNAITLGGSGGETDECIDISDIFDGGAPEDLGEFCAEDSPVSVPYTGLIEVTEESECAFEVPNVASFLTNDTQSTGEDTVIVQVVRTDCGEAGCTRTQGYWKTHSIYGPAPYDDTWAAIGEDTAFFLSGQSYYEVMWTAPKGNAYYNLAHQYIAAVLNVEAGATAPDEVIDAIAEAELLFAAWTPAQIGALRGNAALRQDFLELAELLDDYNNGLIGPGHCSDESEEEDD